MVLPDGAWAIEVIDTWNMTVDRLDGNYRTTARVPLPGRPFMAVRLIRVGD